MSMDVVTLIAASAPPAAAETAAAAASAEGEGFDARLDEELAGEAATAGTEAGDTPAAWLALAALLAAGAPVPAVAQAPVEVPAEAASVAQAAAEPLPSQQGESAAAPALESVLASAHDAARELTPESVGATSAPDAIAAQALAAASAEAPAAAGASAALESELAAPAGVLAPERAAEPRTPRELAATGIEASPATPTETASAVGAPAATAESGGREPQNGPPGDAHGAASPLDPAATPPPGATAAIANGPAPVAATTSVHAPASPVSVEAVPVHVEWLAARGGGTARIELHPPDLGPLEISVSVRGQRVEVVLAAREPEAAALLQGHGESLGHSLASLDLRMERFEVRNGGLTGDPSRDAFAGNGSGFSFARDAGGDAGFREGGEARPRPRAALGPELEPMAARASAAVQATARASASGVDLRI